MTISALASHVCAQPGCPVLARDGHRFCDAHQPTRIVGPHHKVYNTQRWRRFRLRILQQRPWCEHCLRQGKPTSILGGCTDQTTGRSEHVHHVIDLADKGAPFDPKNVEALSHACHSKETRARQRLAAA